MVCLINQKIIILKIKRLINKINPQIQVNKMIFKKMIKFKLK